MVKTKSRVWEFFSGDVERAYCKKCGQSYVDGKAMRMQRHVTVNCKSMTTEEKNRAKRRIESTPISNNIQAPTETLSHRQSGGLTTYLDIVTAEEQEELDNDLLKAVIGEGVPFSFLSNEHFINFIKKLRPSYSIPSNNYVLSTKLLPAAYKKLQNEISI